MEPNARQHRFVPTRVIAERHDDWVVEGTMLRRLRRLFPPRPMNVEEAWGIAERQAQLMLAVWGVDTAPVEVDAVGELSAVTVTSWTRLPVAGASLWSGTGWVIVLDTGQCREHQRHTVAHEFKHIVDHTSGRRYADDDVAEPIADYFARCLLVPRPWLKVALARGVRGVPDLAGLFGVPHDVMRVRLGELDLAEQTLRCGRFSRRCRSRCRRRVCPR